MTNIFRWLDERLDLRRAKRDLLDREVPDRLTWWHTLGSATLTVFVVQVITGTTLATYYSASPDHAYDSIQYLSREVARGTGCCRRRDRGRRSNTWPGSRLR